MNFSFFTIVYIDFFHILREKVNVFYSLLTL